MNGDGPSLAYKPILPLMKACHIVIAPFARGNGAVHTDLAFIDSQSTPFIG